MTHVWVKRLVTVPFRAWRMCQYKPSGRAAFKDIRQTFLFNHTHILHQDTRPKVLQLYEYNRI